MRSINLTSAEQKINEKEYFKNLESNQKNKNLLLDKQQQKLKKLSKTLGCFAFLLVITTLIILFTNQAFGGIFQQWQTVVYNTEVCVDEACTTKTAITTKQNVCKGLLCTDRQLLKTDNRTNVLLLGVDTLGDNPGDATFGLTDTIMLVSFDHTNGIATMISFPRDIEVSYKNYYDQAVTTKINEVYFYAGLIEGDKDKGITGIQNVVSKITGIPVHYHAFITIKGLQELVDNIGGITVTLDGDKNDIYPLAQIPNERRKELCKATPYEGDGLYCYWEMSAGRNDLDGLMALVYARSRKYSTDYDRARRQQQVVNGIKDKILSTDTLLNPQKLIDIFNTLGTNIRTSPFDANDIIAGLKLKDIYKGNISVVLDPNFISLNQVLKSTTNSSGQFVVRVNDSSYQTIQKYLKTILTNPSIYQEKPNVWIYSDVDLNTLSTKYQDILSDENSYLGLDLNDTKVNDSELFFGLKRYTNSLHQTTGATGIDKYIVDYTGGKKKNSLDAILKQFPELKVLTVDANFKQTNGEDFAIIIDNWEKQVETTSSASSK